MSIAITILIVLIIQISCLCIEPEDYLLKYGYTTIFPRTVVPRTQSSLSDGIKLFQTMYKIPVTGQMDVNTRQMMARPRCGNPDPVPKAKSRDMWIDAPGDDKGRGYNLEGSKWTNYKMTYRIKESDQTNDNYWSQRVDNTSTLTVIKFAYDVWSAVTPLQFAYIAEPNRKVHTSFQFSRGVHCCDIDSPSEAKFDGNGGTIAHAQFPRFGGDVHIDDDEEFLSFDESQRDAKLKVVLIHEIGLDHVLDPDSVMYPQYKTVINDNYLGSGDIDGIRVLYGNESIKLEGEVKLVVG